mmetsp:Transcript_16340/g.27211  ORF Transcript_16340/g.27211 Transcript_16340/m.27211 type:complete len:235 (+) Transcript_16340:259-963(+)
MRICGCCSRTVSIATLSISLSSRSVFLHNGSRSASRREKRSRAHMAVHSNSRCCTSFLGSVCTSEVSWTKASKATCLAVCSHRTDSSLDESSTNDVGAAGCAADSASRFIDRDEGVSGADGDTGTCTSGTLTLVKSSGVGRGPAATTPVDKTKASEATRGEGSTDDAMAVCKAATLTCGGAVAGLADVPSSPSAEVRTEDAKARSLHSTGLNLMDVAAVRPSSCSSRSCSGIPA